MTHNPLTHRYFLLTVDPVHIGTGGTRLGRVDMSIVREPGTHLPKIPGTSLSGAIRAYAAHRYGKPQCAGQGQQEDRKHCGRPTCPICYTFGTASESGKSHAGVVAIGDARILLFPVYSMVGPVWVTSPGALQDAGLGEEHVSPDKAKWGGKESGLPTDKPINLGWLMVEREGDFPAPNWPEQIPEQIRHRAVLVSDKLFSQIVNSNLEVRTSVSINPETGAAEDKALFTYEAIPRATVLWMDVVVDDYRKAFPSKSQLEAWKNDLEQRDDAAKNLVKQWHLGKEKDGEGKFDNSVQKALGWVQDDLDRYGNDIDWKGAAQVVTSGLEWAEHLGVGGMGTRGFGRIRQVVRCEVTDTGALEKCEKKNAHGNTGSTEK